MKLTEEETNFVQYWEVDRLRRKRVLRQLSIGLPLSSLLVAAIFINFFSGWYKRADMELRAESSSLVLVVVIAALLIVVFMTIFSVKHTWDINEQRYLELLAKRDRAEEERK